MALGLLFVRSEGVLGLRAWSDRGLNRAIAVVATLLLALLLIASATRYSTGDLDSMAVFVLPFLAVLIGLLAFGRGTVARALAHPRMLWLGEISYGVYIVHWPVWFLLSALAASALHLSANNPVLFVAYLALVLIVAGASFVYLERPARRFIRRPLVVAEGRLSARIMTGGFNLQRASSLPDLGAVDQSCTRIPRRSRSLRLHERQ